MGKFFSRTLYVFLFCALLPGYASAEIESDSLDQAMHDAFASYPEVQDRWHAYLAAQDDRRRVLGGYLPSVNIDASLGRRDRNYDGRSQHTQSSAEVSLTQMLFDGFRIRSQLQRADHTVLQRYYELLDSAEHIAAETAGAYLDVQRYRKLVDLAKINVQNHQRVYDQIELRERRGVGNKADLQQISGRLALARTNLLTDVANLRDVKTRFQRLTGRPPMLSMKAAPLTKVANEGDLGAILLDSYVGNPGLFARFEAIAAAQAKIKESSSGMYPKLEFGLRHGIFQNDNGFSDIADGHARGGETVAELRLHYNLFRGGQDSAATRADAHRVERTEDLRDQACINLRQTTTISYNNVMNLEQRLMHLRAHRDSSIQVVTAYRQQFDIGRRSLLDVLDAENESFQAERAYFFGQYEQTIARYNLLRDQGGLIRGLALFPEKFASLDELGGETMSDSARNYCERFAGLPWDSSISEDRLPTQKGNEFLVLKSNASFASGSASLLPSALEQLKKFADSLNADPDVQELSILGHTDSSGNADSNRDLSIRRAIAVKDYLIESGLTQIVLSTRGFGSDRPVQSNATPKGRAANRRVEIEVVRRQKP